MSNIPDNLDGEGYLSLADEHEGEAKLSYKSVCECYVRAYAALGAEAFWAACEARGKKRFVVHAFLKNGGWVNPNPAPQRSPLGPMKAAVRKYFFKLTEAQQEEVVAIMLGDKR
jgi:hypothetical protein